MRVRALKFASRHLTALNAPVLPMVVRTIDGCLAFLDSRLFSALWRALDLIARKPVVSVAVVGFAALVASIGVSLLVRMPAPRVHDEFSYLLAADTFARGRLTNPTHPLWVHFESFHINHQPTYQSKYPPAQGLILAAGQLIGGHAVVGLWLSVALACAAICWMLQAWLPPRWALLGGLLAILHPGILLRWGQTYWGGAVAVIGGALLFGALRRIVRRQRVPDALMMGVGLAILANSRPFEGLIVSLVVTSVLLFWMVGKNGPAWRISTRHIVLPILAVLAPTAAGMGYYNFRGTGDPLRMPYQVHEATYVPKRFFLFRNDSRPEPIYRHQVMRNYYNNPSRQRTTGDQEIAHDSQAAGLLSSSVTGSIAALKTSMKRAIRLWKFYLGVALTIPLFMLPWVVRDKWMRFALFTCGVLILVVVSRWLNPHYAAPITGLVFALVMQSMRHLRLLRWHGRPTGRLVALAVPVLCAAWLAVSLTQKIEVKPAHAWSLQRARLAAELNSNGDRHLVIVRYPPMTSWTKGEWVYNEADIDGSKIVWAREMDAARNRKLLKYFSDRRAWLLELKRDHSVLKLAPYPAVSAPDTGGVFCRTWIPASSLNESCW